MRGRSKILLVATVLATIYAFFIITYCLSASNIDFGGDEITAMIVESIMVPHMIAWLIATALGWLGYCTKKTGTTLIAALLYLAFGLLFIIYAMITVPISILAFIGYRNQKKLNKAAA